MTEQAWLECVDPELMVQDRVFQPNQRKMGLFLAACYQRVQCLGDPPTATAVELFEKWEDGSIVESDLWEMMRKDSPPGMSRSGSAVEVIPLWWQVLTILRSGIKRDALHALYRINRTVWTRANDTTAARRAPPGEEADAARKAWAEAESVVQDHQRRQCELLRDIFGNPFRQVAFDPRWRSGNTIELGAAICKEKAFERMPILADALMDAGCDDAVILDHCRADTPHVRGCWVVDLVLARE